MAKYISTFLFGFAALAFIACKSESSSETTAETAPVETVATTTGADQVFHVDPAASVIHWEGYKPAMGVTHTGTVKVSDGQLTVEDGEVSGGSFTIDFTTITNTDQQGDSKAKLEAHLKGTAEGKEDDFFNIQKYPTGKFEITKVTALEGDADANTMIYGNLTIKDVTKNIGFKADVNMMNGTVKATTPMFKIDRTEWGIKVLSKKFFENLQDNFVSDEFGVKIELKASAGQDI